MDTTLQLDSITFQGFEIPERITLGGAQSLVTHKLPGGDRVVQAMGRDDDPIQWSGMFLGQDALERARAVDSLRIKGQAVFLSFHGFFYSVVVQKFTYTDEAFYRIPYTLELLVIEDLTQQSYSSQPVSMTDAINEDSTAAVTAGAAVGDSPLSNALATMDSAIKSVSDFAKSAQSTINSVLAPIAAVQQRVTSLISSASNTLSNVTTLGGILPNNPIAQQAAKLSTQVTAATQLPVLYNIQALTGRITTNLNLVNSPAVAAAQTVAGGTLFDVAAKAYGDATKYVAIAQANGLTETNISSLQTLTIPNSPPDNGGIPT